MSKNPKFAHLYVYDPATERNSLSSVWQNILFLPNDTPSSERRVCKDILRDLKNELLQHNPCVREFLKAVKFLKSKFKTPRLSSASKKGQGKLDHEYIPSTIALRYLSYCPTPSEIGIILYEKGVVEFSN